MTGTVLDSVLDLGGPSFLALYAAIALAALVFAFLRRRRFGPPAPLPPPKLDTLETAYLAGGAPRVGDTALVGLTALGAATYDSGSGRFARAPAVAAPPGLRGFAEALVQPMRREAFRAAGRQPIEAVRAGLAARGLVAGAAERRSYLLGTYAILAVPLALGGAKVAVGLDRDRPVEFLVMLMLATIVAAIILARPRHLPTRAGAAALAKARRGGQRLLRAPRTAELAIAFALGGAAVLAGTELSAFGRRIAGSGGDGSSTDSSDSSSGSDSDSSGGGGSSSGCGGCSSGSSSE